jgi:hypothetical protein
MAKSKSRTFSATKAVKANARERLGTPPPSTPIPDRKHKAEHGPEKHKKPLARILERAEQAEEA